MIVENPRRAREGGSVAAEHFRPELGVSRVAWTEDADGNLALDVQGTRTWTEAEQQEIRDYCQSLSDADRIRRDRARQALTNLDAIAGSQGDLDITQLSNAARLFARVLGALVRMALRLRD